MTAFTHHDDSTPEAVWRDALARHPLPEFGTADFAGLEHLVVVASHPDDETLGAGGLLARAYAAGVRSSVVVATSGEASHPESATIAPAELGRVREAETAAAVAELDPGAALTFLRLPDGRLADPQNVAALAAALDEVLAPPAAQTPSPEDTAPADAEMPDPDPAPAAAADAPSGILVVAPWAGDRHPDHQAAALAAGQAARRHGARLLGYPIWLWHWAQPDGEEVPWEAFLAVPLDDAVREAKGRALQRHVSQVRPLSGLPGDEVLLAPAVLEHFKRAVELFVQEPAVIAPDPLHLADDGGAGFDALHAGDPDPWGFETRWYEQRKRAVLLAALPQRAVSRTLEVGCSTGVLSRELALRSESFLGIDVSAVAVERARERNHDLPAAAFERMRAPEQWPEGGFDLVVLSELGYYLDDDELLALIERMTGSLEPGGAVVCCHWRHPVAGRTQTGDSVHAVVRERSGLAVLVQHLEEDFVLEVFVRPPALSVAAQEGIV
ncbi:PIG-L family deacetylase [Herbiconiux sp.]|uniref:PIG-L family deacetylase n=1 Tax=Herbiconiux sp. TaxID=1871186 RepID=UPI0025BED449|nr:PIG-L family deacetylase [Herbiconiux sp.]